LRSELRPSDITLVAVVRVECGARFAEEGIHLLLHAQHIQGEWFYLYMTQELLESLAKRMTLRWKILHGDRPQVSAITVKRLARVLGVSTDYLLGMDVPESELLPAMTDVA
jgi:transcriptional regulator with XRE-family HTH domain